MTERIICPICGKTLYCVSCYRDKIAKGAKEQIEKMEREHKAKRERI